MKLSNVIVDWVRTNKDWSCKITLVTRELSAQEMANIFLSLNQEIMEVEIPDEVWDTKSKAQRLRQLLWRIWNDRFKDKYETSELFYSSKMEQIMTALKDKYLD